MCSADRRLVIALPLAVLATSSMADRAHAVGQDERMVSLEAGYARGRREVVPHGGAAALAFHQGWTDSWAGRASLALAVGQPVGVDEGVRAMQLGAGATYAVDVLRVVPFLDLGVSLQDLRGAGPSRQDLGWEAALGAEYLLDRAWSLAIAGRLRYHPLSLGGDGPAPWLATLGVRLGRIF